MLKINRKVWSIIEKNDLNFRKARGDLGMVEKVRCFKDLRVGCDTYYFVYGDSPKPPKGVLIGFIYFVDDETEISIKDDSLVVPHLIEMMYDCLDDKKSFKVKF